MAVDGSLNFDTKVNTKGFNSGTKSLTGGLSKIGAMLGRVSSSESATSKRFIGNSKNVSGCLEGVKSKLGSVATAVAAAFSVKKLIDFGKTAVTAASETSNAWQGLESIMNGQGRSYGQATKWIQQYVSDGLVPLSNAVTAYKNLAARGYDDTQIQNVLTALKDSAAFGRQASYSLGDAVTSATEGLKNENSILVDNAGVTKNVAKMWDDYAKSIGTTSNNLTQQQKIQAEVNGILTETRFQAGDAAKVANTFSGQVSKLRFNFDQLKVTWGNIITAYLKPLIEYINLAIQKIISFSNSIAKALGVANSTNSSVSALSDSSADMTDTSSDAADSYTDMAEAAEKAKKANERSLASFDKITKLSDNKSDDTSAASGVTALPTTISAPKIKQEVDVDTNKAEKKIKDFFKWLKDKLKGIFEPIKKAWDKTGGKVIKSIKNALKQVKKLLETIGKTFTDIWNDGTGEQVVSDILEIISDIFGVIGDIADALRKAWRNNNNGRKFVKSILDLTHNILKLVHVIIESFRKVLNNGTAQKTFELILSILTGINDIISEITEAFTEAWEENGTGESIIQHIFDLINGILDSINNIVTKTKEWAQQIDFQPFLTSVDEVVKALDPFADTVGAGLEWFWTNVLLPMADWTIENIIPDFLGLVAGAIEVLGTVIDAAKPVLDWIWTNIIKPFAEKIGNLLISAIKGLTEKFKKFSDWAKNNKDNMQTVSNIIIGFLAGLVFYVTTKKIVDVVGNIRDAIMQFGDKAHTAGGKVALLATAIGILATGISAISQNWDKMNPMERTATIFWSLAAAASAAAVAVAIFHTSWSVGAAAAGIAGGLAALGLSMGFATNNLNLGTGNWNVNGATTWQPPSLEEMQKHQQDQQKAFEEENQKLLEQFPALAGQNSSNKNQKSQTSSNNKSTTKDVDVDEYYKIAEKFYNDYGLDEEYKLPKFATGTVVPANYGEFLAILGDNKREREYVSPESAMKQSFKDAIAEMGGVSGGTGPIVVELYMDKRKIHQEIVDVNNSEIRKRGANPLAPAMAH